MKLQATVIALYVACTAAFAPQANVKQSTALFGLFETISNMDLFAPNKGVNDYGARNKKNLATGKITDKSYVPAGLTAAEYEKIRNADAAKKQANYERNVKKAGVFTDYTEWYKKRGTDTSGEWKKSVTLGHRMAKTKYDWSGSKDNAMFVGLEAKPKKK